MLQIHNTMTGRKEVFEPLIPGTVRMYVCGVTVYDYCHIGHARSALIFDVIRRYLIHRGFVVTFVKNFTDIDDKIINRANELKISWQSVAATFISAYHEDMERMGVCPATIQPKATEHIANIIALVQVLCQKGIAYQVNGDVYFQVDKFPAYGHLSKRRLDDMHAGARVEVNERKRHPMDFVLWKEAKPGEPSWDSPWGPGRPGWHIECSAMSIRHLGETFDIHGGGADLIFPHHENEIAQSSSATDKEFARYWIHNGFVQIRQEKMSKSLGNFFTIREIFAKSRLSEKVTGEVLRYFLLTTHYRSSLDFSDQGLAEAKRALDGFYGLFQRLEEPERQEGSEDELGRKAICKLESTFELAMDDDFNTPAAIAGLQRLRNEVNRILGPGQSKNNRLKVLESFRRFGRILGLFQLKDWEFKSAGDDEATMDNDGIASATFVLDDIDVEMKIIERNEARRQKNFVRADEIRTQLAAHGITIEDRPDGTSRWKR